MICKSKCVVLSSRKYSESSKILNVYTKDYGKLTLIAKGAFSPKSKFLGMVEMLNAVEVEFYFKQNREMHTLSNVDADIRFKNIKNDIELSTSAMICCELVNKTQNIGEINENIYLDLIESFKLIDLGLSFLSTLKFINKIISHLGYGLINNADENLPFTYFDYQNGNLNNNSGVRLTESETLCFISLFHDEKVNIDIEKNDFLKIFNALIRFLKIHLDRNIKINSIELLN